MYRGRREGNEMGIPGMFKGRFRKQGRMEKGMSKSQEDSSLPGEWPIPGLRQGKYKMSLEHLLPESKGKFKE